MPRWLRIALDAAKAWNADNAFKHSAAVSFYTLFSLAPITLIAVNVAGAFFGTEIATKQFSSQVGQLVGRESAELIQKTMEAGALKGGGWWSTTISVVVLIVGATTVFGQLEESLNNIWGVTSKPSRAGWIVMVVTRLISFAMVITVGFLLITSMILSTALSAVIEIAQGWMPIPAWLLRAVDLGVGLAIITVLFALLFKVLPDARIRWREAWRGAFVTALLFSVGRQLIALYLSHSTVASDYGAAGSLVALLMWIYYSCAILFYGAEVVRAHRLHHGLTIEPSDNAVLVRRELVEQTRSGKPTGKRIKTDMEPRRRVRRSS